LRPSHKDESKAQPADSAETCNKPRAFHCCRPENKPLLAQLS